jgi:hypothetical protein
MIQQAIRAIRILLPASSSVTPQEIEDAVTQILFVPSFSEIDKATLIREVQAIYNIRMDEFRIIEKEESRLPWLNDQKTSIDWNFWSRYRDYLQDEKNYPETVLNQLDKLTDRTLDGLFNPNVNGSISKYGLVVGQVQSGKTSNYTGLICKAADAGFKLIIVLAGIHNNLRSQTQLRLDEGFLGFDTQFQRAFNTGEKTIGVGIGKNALPVHSVTSSADNGDFSALTTLAFNTNEPIVAVVKKNTKVLEKLFQWLSSQTSPDANGVRRINEKSLLLIDDEADNASINTNKDEDKSTKINEHIRNILRLFDKSGYVGYTATPFANIFIPIEDDQLFPRDFIINIQAPSNYIGPEKVFGIKVLEDDEISDEVLPIVNKIDDFQNLIPNGHKRDSELPGALPDSLRLAIKSFIITCAIRRLRGQEAAHNSMLIHVSRFTNWQDHIKDLVENVFDFYRRGIEMKIPSVLEEIREVFEIDSDTHKSYKSVSQQILNSELKNIDSLIQIHNWGDVVRQLHEAVVRIQVKKINGGSADVLNYYEHRNGLSVIAIGGDKLSRGLTLEGLSVSYYLRASRMYDTLMQMGRWFGYRPGYVDLCRLFTSRELNEWFCHITLASEELRSEFDYMADVAGSTPEQYALRVRTHPGVLQISASNKIRKAEAVRVSWSGRLVESYLLSSKQATINKNLAITVNFINNIGINFRRDKNYFLWQNVSFENVKYFLQGFQVHDNLKASSTLNILRFIEKKYAYGEIKKWNIGLITKNAGTLFQVNENISVNLINRTPSKESTKELYYINKSHIISPDDEFIDLTETEISQAKEASQRLWTNKKGTNEAPKRLNGDWVRNQIRKPNKVLLLLYFLNPEKVENTDMAKPIVGFAISFPGSDRDDAESFMVHSQLLPQFNIADEIENDNNDED